MSLSVLSSQRLQAQRDAQAARARADRLQELSRQAQDEATQATARSQDLNRQSQTSRQDATQAQQRADRTPARQTVQAPSPADAASRADNPPTNNTANATPSTVQRVGQDILAQVSGYTSSAAAKSATQAYQRVQAAVNLAAASPVSPSANSTSTGSPLSAVV
jgi:hypothetical protein